MMLSLGGMREIIESLTQQSGVVRHRAENRRCLDFGARRRRSECARLERRDNLSGGGGLLCEKVDSNQIARMNRRRTFQATPSDRIGISIANNHRSHVNSPPPSVETTDGNNNRRVSPIRAPGVDSMSGRLRNFTAVQTGSQEKGPNPAGRFSCGRTAVET